MVTRQPYLILRTFSSVPLPLLAAFEMRVKIVVKPTAGGSKIEKECETEWTIQEVKEALADQASIPATEQRLIYKGQILKDERTVESYGAWCSLLGWPRACPTATTADTPALSCSCRDWE